MCGAKAFQLFDKDGDGSVTVKEVEAVCKEYGLPTKHVKTFVDMVDHNKDGFLSVFELQDFFSTYERERVEDSTAAIRSKLPKAVFARFRTLVDTPGFRELDRAHDGRLAVADLEALCRRRNLPRAHVRTVVDLLTKGGTCFSTITGNAYIACTCVPPAGLPSAHEFFK